MGKKVPPDWSELGDELIGKRRWRLGVVEFDEVSRELRRNGERVAVEPKPLDCLIALLRRRNDVVSKQDLCRWVWSGRTVSESVLTKSMAKLRDAMGDDEQTMIKTVHGLGYRLVADVVEIEPEDCKMQLRARHPLPRHPELRLLRLVDEKRGLWSGERVDDLAPRLLIVGSESSTRSQLRREVQFCRKLQARPESAAFAVPMREWELDQAPYFFTRDPLQASALPDWLAQNQRLSATRTDERLGFFADICEAVAVVHEAGLHFEGGLNPDCFLVTELSGRPMQIQVCTGLASTWPQISRTLGVIPERYVAPELQEGVAPSMASDIYALGVIGYHLLTGRWTAALSPGWEGMLPDPQLLGVLTRATHQSLNQRLGSARELAQMLRDLPQVRAAAQLTRQAQAMAQAVTPAAVPVAVETAKVNPKGRGPAVNARPWWIVSVLIVLALVIVITQVLRAHHAQAAVASQQAREVAIHEVLGEALLAKLDPYQNAQSRQSLAGIVADAGAATSKALWESDPAVQQRLNASKSRAFMELGLIPQAKALAAEGWRQSEARLGERDAVTVRAGLHYAAVLTSAAEWQQGRSVLKATEPALPYLPRVHRDDLAADVMLQGAELLLGSGQFTEAYSRVKAAVAAGKPPRSVRDAQARLLLAQAYMGQGQWRLAAENLEPALVWAQASAQPQDDDLRWRLWQARHRLSLALEETDAANAALARLRSLAGEARHPSRLSWQLRQAVIEQELALAPAAATADQARALLVARNAVLAAAHPQTLHAAQMYASALIAAEQWPQALAIAQPNHALARARLGEANPLTLELGRAHVLALHGAGELAAAHALAAQLADTAAQFLPAQNSLALGLMALKGDLLVASDAAQARLVWSRALKLARGVLPAKHGMVVSLQARIAPSAGDRQALGEGGSQARAPARPRPAVQLAQRSP